MKMICIETYDPNYGFSWIAKGRTVFITFTDHNFRITDINSGDLLGTIGSLDLGRFFK